MEVKARCFWAWLFSTRCNLEILAWQLCQQYHLCGALQASNTSVHIPKHNQPLHSIKTASNVFERSSKPKMSVFNLFFWFFSICYCMHACKTHREDSYLSNVFPSKSGYVGVSGHAVAQKNTAHMGLPLLCSMKHSLPSVVGVQSCLKSHCFRQYGSDINDFHSHTTSQSKCQSVFR